MNKVGIFWFYQDRLLVAAVPLQDGIEDELSINGPYDHFPYWETVRRTIPALRTVEYEALPRGRVLYKKAERRCVVYMDNFLHQDIYKQAIRHHFALPSATPFLTDTHYTTAPEDLERLFDAPS